MSATIKQIAQVKPEYSFESYAHIAKTVSSKDGGYLITVSDMPGCLSEGKTEAGAVANGRDAFVSWVSARVDASKSVPKPTYQPEPVAMA